MAKKKRGSKSKSKKNSNVSKDKLKIAQRGFLWSLVLAVLFYLIYSFSSGGFFGNLFGVLWIVFGFLGLAFLISLIVLWVASRK